MASKKVLAHIKDREGVIYESYLDSLKKPTAGVGHLLTKDEQKLYPTGTKIPKAQVDKWLKEDLAKAETAAKTQADQMRAKGLAVDPNFEESLISVNFQLGTGWTTKFPTAWKNLQSGNYEGAVEEIKFTSEGSGTESDWAKQTPTRVNDFTQAIRNQADYKPGKQSNLSNYEKAQNMVAGGDDNIIAGLMPQEEVVTETQEVVEQRPTGFKQLEQQMFNPMQSNYANQNLPNAPRNLGTVELPPDQTITPYRETIKEDVTVRPDQIRTTETIGVTAPRYSIGEQQERARRSMMHGNRQDRMEDYQVNREYQEDYPYLYPRNTGSYALPQQQAAQRMMGGGMGYAQGGTVNQAQGLASLGRGGDSTLVHMQPQEVAGLQQLAQANGTSLTTNPMTGYPEAFSLGNMFKSALPIAVGYFTGGAATPFLGAGTATASAITAGAATGAGLAAMSGEDVLAGGLSGGLGGYSGMGLESAVANMPGATVPVGDGLKQQIAADAAYTGSLGGMQVGTPTANIGAGGTGMNIGGGGFGAQGSAVNDPMMLAGSKPGGTIMQDSPLSTFDRAIEGARRASGTPAGDPTFGKVTIDGKVSPIEMAGTPAVAGTTPQALMKLGSPIASMGLGGLEESDFYNEPDFSDPRDKYNPYSKLNLNKDTGVSDAMRADTGLRLFAEGGKVADPGALNLGGRTQGPTGQGLNLGRGVGSLNLNTGAMGQSANARAAAAAEAKRKAEMPQFKMIGSYNNIQVPADYIGGVGTNYYRDISGKFIRRAEGGLIPAAYAEGGYLQGPGDGMSDNIPANIDGNQSAALSTGEYVVSADVVSSLGNGSSEAGAKRLHAMMDRVRKATTGRKAQATEINPSKYMPA